MMCVCVSYIFNALEINKYTVQKCMYAVQKCIYTVYMYINALQVHMSTSGRVTHYMG